MRALMAAVLIFAVSPAFAGPNDTWTVDASRSKVEFSVQQTGKFVSGRVGSWSAGIVLDPANLAAARIDVRLDLRTASANSRDIDGLMLGPDFLDVKATPEARFVSETVTARGADRYEARGKLTLRGTTRDIVLPFSLQIRDDSAAMAKGKIDIKRLDYGIGRGEWAGTTHVANEVTIELSIVATRPR
jgi:polyisoprenoid-binding protein YceI